MRHTARFLLHSNKSIPKASGVYYIDIPNPVATNDTISMEMEVMDKRRIGSVDGADMVTIDSKVTNQDGEAVFAGDMKFLVKNKGEWDEETHP